MSTHSDANPGDFEAAVRARYSGAARTREASLCCPTSYPRELLEAIPEEVIERDYGCGNPAEHLRLGETVLDLGSGAGKSCFIAAQVVGRQGHVIGVDMNDEMLALARRAAPQVAERIGYDNVSFRRGRIQDLGLDLDRLERHLDAHPVRTARELAGLELEIERMRREAPLVPEESVDVVVSNCVLNLVAPAEKARLFAEIQRVLRSGGRAVISDIVSDEVVPERLQRDPELWSGCVSGALVEDRFLAAFEDAGMYGVTLLSRQERPWRVVEGIEFRSVTVVAYKGRKGPCLDQKHAVMYRGPFREVLDDDGHALRRGIRTAVCEKTFSIYAREPYRDHVELITPVVLVPLAEASPFPCDDGARIRKPSETKGGAPLLAAGAAEACCGPQGCCP